MNNFIQKSLFNLSIVAVITMLFSTAVQAANFSKSMKLGIVGSSASGKTVVIYNDDYTKCLSSSGHKRSSSNTVTYAACEKDNNDIWVITKVGKIKNMRTGKCLSTLKGKDSLVLMHCNYVHYRDYIEHDFIVLDRLVTRERDGIQIANK